MEESKNICFEFSRLDVGVCEGRDLGVDGDVGAGFVGLGDGDAFSEDEHISLRFVDIDANCANRNRAWEPVRLFESSGLTPTSCAIDTTTTSAVMAATAHGEVGAAVEAFRGTLVVDPYIVEGV